MPISSSLPELAANLFIVKSCGVVGGHSTEARGQSKVIRVIPASAVSVTATMRARDVRGCRASERIERFNKSYLNGRVAARPLAADVRTAAWTGVPVLSVSQSFAATSSSISTTGAAASSPYESNRPTSPKRADAEWARKRRPWGSSARKRRSPRGPPASGCTRR